MSIPIMPADETRPNKSLIRRDAAEAVSRAVWLVRHKKYIPALDIFEENLGRLRLAADSPRRLRLMSFYGLCLAMVWGQARRARDLCETAVEKCNPDADLFFNLGMVHLRERRRDLALEVFREGLGVDRMHTELLETLDRLRPRRPPVFPFLDRKHPVNRFGGMLRSRVARLWSADDPLAGIPAGL